MLFPSKTEVAVLALVLFVLGGCAGVAIEYLIEHVGVEVRWEVPRR